jgi:nicotinamidase-related amidase
VQFVDWTHFLTERDRAVLASTSWAKRAPFGLGARPAVLVVDVYYAALGLPRADILDVVGRWPSACGEVGWDAVDRTVPVLAAARAAAAPVIYFHQTPAEFGRWNRKPAAALATRGDGVDPNGIVGELEPAASDVVLTKIGPSCFHETPLDTVLRMADRDTVLVCGEATSGCVRATVVDACTRGYRVGVIGDCCFDRLEASHWTSLFDMDQKYGDVMSADDVLAYLSDVDDGRRGAA